MKYRIDGREVRALEGLNGKVFYMSQLITCMLFNKLPQCQLVNRHGFNRHLRVI